MYSESVSINLSVRAAPLPAGLTFPAVDIIIIARMKQKTSTHL